jgi:hypothetical protein
MEDDNHILLVTHVYLLNGIGEAAAAESNNSSSRNHDHKKVNNFKMKKMNPSFRCIK